MTKEIDWRVIIDATGGVRFAGDGGFLIPQKIRRPRKGFIAWLWRLVGSENGFEWIDIHGEIAARVFAVKFDRNKEQ